MKNTIKLPLKKTLDESYEILIEPRIGEKIPMDLKKQCYGASYAIITDHKVKKLYGDSMLDAMNGLGLKTKLISFPQGEKEKNIRRAEKIAVKMLRMGFDRSSCVIALGGGVAGDLAGFVSAIFMRGIPFVHIPTTLLAMVDSSVGGKTGVDTKIGKNMLGSFHQPRRVYIDTSHLRTLPIKEIRNGLVELIKHAIIRDADLFDFLEKNVEKIMALEPNIMNKIIAQSCRIKARIVSEDEKENGTRMLLNYGHTIGHAMEQKSRYRMPHGLCVAKGILAINEIAVKKNLMSETEARKIEELFKKFQIDGTFPFKRNIEAVIKLMQKDKKFQNGIPNLVISPKIGAATITQQIPLDDIRKLL